MCGKTQICSWNLRVREKTQKKISAMGTVVLKYLPLTFCSKGSVCFVYSFASPAVLSIIQPWVTETLEGRRSGHCLHRQIKGEGGKRQRMKAEALLVGSVLRAHRPEREGGPGKGRGKGWGEGEEEEEVWERQRHRRSLSLPQAAFKSCQY